MGLDKNKHISSITYNYLNKSEKITVTGQGVITYVYDAAGNRLQKRIEDQVNNTEKVYDYIGNFVYEDSMLQYILNEEGRCRPVADSTTNDLTKFVYDYFIKDHLGNVRSTVTAQPMSPAYLAMHEIASANIEQLVFDNIPNVRNGKPGSMDPNDGMAAKLVAEDPETRVGTSILLRTMPGDRFNINVKSFYEGDPQPEGAIELDQMVESLVNTLSGGINYDNVPISELPENAALISGLFANPSITELIEAIPVKNSSIDAPRAFLNVLFFDEDFNLVPELSQRIQVRSNGPGNPQWYTSENDFNTATYVGPGQPGYLAVFIDNQEIGKDVWFDDLFIGHYTSEVLEENHYYPFGLTLSSTAMGTEQPYKYQTKELEKSFGLEMYDFEARMVDPQLGRTWQPDPHAELYSYTSPYSSMNNNPIIYIDPDGKDYKLHFKEEEGKNTVTVQATYYVGPSSAASADEAKRNIESQNGKFQYLVGEGDDAKVFDVDFQINIVQVKVDPNLGEEGSVNEAFDKDKSGMANAYKVVSNNKLKYSENGKTIDGTIIKVAERAKEGSTGAHEMGHTLGMVHYKKGLMADSEKSQGGNTNLQAKDVSDMIKYTLRGKVNSEYINSQKVNAGKGHFSNDSSVSDKMLKKGQVIQK